MHQCWQSRFILGGVGLLVTSAMPAMAQSDELSSVERAEAMAQGSALADVWQPASPEEEDRVWNYVLNSPLGIAALNQLAIEGFISPLCDKTLYTHTEYGGFQTLLQVECPEPRGTSIARAYDEVRVTFNRFEDNIESFDIERVYREH